MTTKEMREYLNVSRAEFSRRYNIPVRTLENWESGKSQCPDYVGQLLERAVKEDAKKEEARNHLGVIIMTSDMVLNNLKELIGKEFDEDDVICAFEDYEVDGETSVYVGDSDNSGYDKIAYIDTENSVQFLFKINSENIIEDVWME